MIHVLYIPIFPYVYVYIVPSGFIKHGELENPRTELVGG